MGLVGPRCPWAHRAQASERRAENMRLLKMTYFLVSCCAAFFCISCYHYTLKTVFKEIPNLLFPITYFKTGHIFIEWLVSIQPHIFWTPLCKTQCWTVGVWIANNVITFIESMQQLVVFKLYFSFFYLICSPRAASIASTSQVGCKWLVNAHWQKGTRKLGM